MNQIELKHAVVSLLEEGIMHVHIKPNSDIELADVILIVEAIGKLGGEKKYPVLIDAGEFVSIDREARIFSATAESNIYTLADAIAYCNLAQKLLAQFYIKHNRPVVPTRAFDSKDEAMAWLKTYLKKANF